VVCDDRILWVAGQQVAHGAAAPPDASHALELSLEEP
jgi:hypothetical protein